MKNGLYKCEMRTGKIFVSVKDTKAALSLKLISNSVKYDAPQIDAMFYETKEVKIKKPGGRHGYVDFGDNSFTLYPYRVGVPYYFELTEGN